MTLPSLRKMFLVTPELWEKFQNKPDEYAQQLNKNINTILHKKNKEENADETLTKLRKFQDPYLKLMQNKRKPIPIPFFEESTPLTSRPVLKIKRKIQSRVQPSNRFVLNKKNVNKKNVIEEVEVDEEEDEKEEGEEEEEEEEKEQELEDIREKLEDDEYVYDGTKTPTTSNPKRDKIKQPTFTKERVERYTSKFGDIASQYISPYFYRKHNTDSVYGIYRDNNYFKIGNSIVTVSNNDIFIDNIRYKGTKGLWELLTKNVVDKKTFTTEDLNQYKNVLIQTKAHLDRAGKIKSSRGEKYKTIIASLFPSTKKPSWTRVN